jgi:hypothetical protein
MRQHLAGLTLAGIAALFLVACGGGGGGSSSSSSSGGTANTAPVANAGANQTVNSGATVTLNGGASSDANGTIASYAWTQTAGAMAIILANPTSATPTFSAPTVSAATAFTFSLVVTDNLGLASTAATTTVTVNPAAAGTTNVTGQVTFARVPFRTTGSNPGLDYANPTQRPARQVVVRALDAGITQAILATGTTDDTGNYTLTVANNTAIRIEVVAQMQRTAAPVWDVRVQDGLAAGTAPYSFTETASFNSSAGVAHNVAIPTGIDANGIATGARASGPFAVLDTIYQGILTVRGVAPASNFPALIVDWGSQANGTFFTTSGGQHIALLADLTEDTDEFDQHVIAHEFGHYVEENFSRADSIGGSHSLGQMIDPRVAFGEGFGYAFAAIVLNDPNARDSYTDDPATSRCAPSIHCSGGFDIEANPPSPNNQACWCSESSVWSILFDLYDTSADGNDTLALGFGPLWNVLVGTQRTTPAFTTIFSFVTALKAARPGDAAAINTLVAAQQVTANDIDAFGTTESHLVPGANSLATLPIYTNISAGVGPIVVATSDDLGRHNKIGNRRFFRFTPTASGLVTITLSSSNPNNADPDFRVYRSGTIVLDASLGPPQPESAQLNVVANTTYIIDAYDCANGCGTVQGTPGDYALTLTIN